MVKVAKEKSLKKLKRSNCPLLKTTIRISPPNKCILLCWPSHFKVVVVQTNIYFTFKLLACLSWSCQRENLIFFKCIKTYLFSVLHFFHHLGSLRVILWEVGYVSTFIPIFICFMILLLSSLVNHLTMKLMMIFYSHFFRAV